MNPNGLVGAFLNAGAAEVVASLWSVDSSKTRTLMINFYRGFLVQLAAGTALREAQDDLRQGVPDLHPYYWVFFAHFRKEIECDNESPDTIFLFDCCGSADRAAFSLHRRFVRWHPFADIHEAQLCLWQVYEFVKSKGRACWLVPRRSMSSAIF